MIMKDSNQSPFKLLFFNVRTNYGSRSLYAKRIAFSEK